MQRRRVTKISTKRHQLQSSRFTKELPNSLCRSTRAADIKSTLPIFTYFWSCSWFWTKTIGLVRLPIWWLRIQITDNYALYCNGSLRNVVQWGATCGLPYLGLWIAWERIGRVRKEWSGRNKNSRNLSLSQYVSFAEPTECYNIFVCQLSPTQFTIQMSLSSGSAHAIYT